MGLVPVSSKLKGFFSRQKIKEKPFIKILPKNRKRSEYGFGEYGFKHRTQEFFGAHWVPGSELSEFLSAYYLCAKANSPSFSQNSLSYTPKLSEAQWLLFSETVLSKQYSARFLKNGVLIKCNHCTADYTK